LFEHDLFVKTGTHAASTARQAFLRIMLGGANAPRANCAPL
jgi:hypothetical protein